MENEKELMGTEPEVTEEVLEEAVEEVVEEIVEEAVEEVVAEETAEVVEEPKKVLEKVYLCELCGAVTEDAVCPVCGKELTKEEAYACIPETKLDAMAKTKKSVLMTVIAAVAVCAVAWCGMYLYKEVYNPYNHGEYKELAFGYTLGELAKKEDTDYKIYLKEGGFPKNMPKSTYLAVAEQYVRLGDLVDEEQLAMYGMTFEDFLKQMGVEGDYTPETLRGEFEAEMTIASYAGISTEEDLKSFVEYYGLEGEIALETKYKEIREQMYRKTYEKQLEQEKAEEAEPEDAPEVEIVEPEEAPEAEVVEPEDAPEEAAE